jgi:hypothetical protein
MNKLMLVLTTVFAGSVVADPLKPEAQESSFEEFFDETDLQALTEGDIEEGLFDEIAQTEDLEELFQ